MKPLSCSVAVFASVFAATGVLTTPVRAQFTPGPGAQRTLLLPAAPTAIAGGFGTADIVTADFDGDLIGDLLVANGGSTAPLYFQGASAGSPTSPPTYANPVPLAVPSIAQSLQPTSIVTSDINLDGLPDAAVLFGNGATSVVVLYFGGATNFATTTPVTAFSTTSPAASVRKNLVAADFDGVNGEDLAVLVTFAGGLSVDFALNSGGGAYSVLNWPTPFVGAAIGFAAADFDVDGDVDVCVAASVCAPTPCTTSFSVLVNDLGATCGGFPQFFNATAPLASVNGAATMISGEFDGSPGHEILMVSNTVAEHFFVTGPATCAPTPVVATGATIALPGGTPNEVVSVVLDSSNLESLVVPDSTGGFSVVRNNGGFVFVAGPTTLLSSTSIGKVVVRSGDVDGDGFPDILAADDGNAPTPGEIGVMINATPQASWSTTLSTGVCTNATLALVGNAGFSSSPYNPGPVNTTFAYSGGPSNQLIRFFAASNPTPTPFAFSPCAIWVNSTTVQIGAGLTDGGGAATLVYQTSNPPPTPGLVGLQFVVQAAAYDPGNTPNDWNWSNGVVVSMGY
jgi:hypothetical protein